MGLFSKLFGGGDDDGVATVDSTSETSGEGATESPAADSNHVQTVDTPSVAAPTPRREKPAARAVKVSEGIRRQRTRTDPGVAPPASSTASDKPKSPTVVKSGSDAKRRGSPPARSASELRITRRGLGSTPAGPDAAASSSNPAPASHRLGASLPPTAPHSRTGVLPPNSARVLEVFRLDLRLGPVTPKWKPTLSKILEQLREHVDMASNPSLQRSLEEVTTLLQRWPSTTGSMPTSLHEELLVACAHLRDASAGALLDDAALERCESLILEAHLEALPEATPLVLRRLRNAGMTTCAAFTHDRAADLAARTAIDATVMTRLIDSVEELLDQRSAQLHRLAHEEPGQVLARLVERVGQLDRQYQAACSTDDAMLKRRLRGERRQQLHTLELTLAKFGEAHVLGSLDRRAVADKVRALRHWLGQQPT